MTKNYTDAVESAFVFWDHIDQNGGSVVEELVAIGYRAGLADSASIAASLVNNERQFLKEQSERGSLARGRFTAVRGFNEKLAAIARKFEARAKELKV